jgi:hypothetical protein
VGSSGSAGTLIFYIQFNDRTSQLRTSPHLPKPPKPQRLEMQAAQNKLLLVHNLSALPTDFLQRSEQQSRQPQLALVLREASAAQQIMRASPCIEATRTVCFQGCAARGNTANFRLIDS